MINECNLIHAHTLFSNGYAAMKLAFKYEKKYIVAVRNTDVNTFFRLLPHLRLIGVKILKNSAAVIFLSPVYREYVISKYVPLEMQDFIRNKSFIIPNGVSKVFIENIGRIKCIKDKNELVLLYVGEITVNKNIKRVIETARIRNAMSKKTRVLIIGTLVDKVCENLLKDSLVEYHKRCTQEELLVVLQKVCREKIVIPNSFRNLLNHGRC